MTLEESGSEIRQSAFHEFTLVLHIYKKLSPAALEWLNFCGVHLCAINLNGGTLVQGLYGVNSDN